MASHSKYKPFPRKKADGKKGSHYDYEHIKHLYINGKDYSFADFCRTHGYRPEGRDHLFGKQPNMLNEWKEDWKRKQITVYDEELTPELFDTTRLVTVQRIKFVKDWTKRVQFIKALFDMSLANQVDNHNFNTRNAAAIKSGVMPPKHTLSYDDMSTVTNTALKIQELEMRSLLVVNDPERMKKLEQEASEVDDTKEIEISQMGKTMNQDEATKLMASYFDQFKESVPLDAPVMIEEKQDATEDQV